MIQEAQEQHLGHKAFILFTLRRMSFGFIILVLVLIIAILNEHLLNGTTDILTSGGIAKTEAVGFASMILTDITLIIFGAGILICLLGVLISLLDYKNYTYTFDEFDLIIKRGILDKKETSIPYRQIQDVNIERPLTYQILGLSKLTFSTAGTEETDKSEMTEVNIEPIDKDTAEEIQGLLQRKIGVQVVEDSVKADKEERAEEK